MAEQDRATQDVEEESFVELRAQMRISGRHPVSKKDLEGVVIPEPQPRVRRRGSHIKMDIG